MGYKTNVLSIILIVIDFQRAKHAIQPMEQYMDPNVVANRSSKTIEHGNVFAIFTVNLLVKSRCNVDSLITGELKIQISGIKKGVGINSH